MKNKLKKKGLSFLAIVWTITSVFAQDKRPNILVILCDDLGYADVGFNGSKDIITPNIDALAHHGTIFSSAYVAHPFCGPSRTSIMTGQYSHAMGAQFNLIRNSEKYNLGIPLTEKFISKELQQAGYFTGAIGKWHLGSNEQFHPNKRGFDEFYGFLGGGHRYFPEQYRPIYEKQKAAGNKDIFDYLTPLEYNGTQVKETAYITDAFSREAITFVNKAAQKKEPFFLYLAYNAPHLPLEAKEEDIKVFTSIKDKNRRTYAAMVYAVDRGVGELVKTLKEKNEFENTLIVFLSDNGGKLGVGSANNNPLKEGKGSAYEGGFRVPMFFHWPKKVKAGKVFEHPVSSIDFYPTFAGLAKADMSKNKKLAGKDVWCSVKANKNPHKDEMLYILRHRTGLSDVAARKNEWKALKVGTQKWKLFNIVKDIREEHDLSTQHPEILKGLVSEAERWSNTHAEPKWFHSLEEGELWKQYNMPRFEETFLLK
ncbi:arylsulfatase A-like enzyme [Wenyingzhuangia heitensis]|uniref:Arylsulfatase A-like enzyme n=1 Tax=Wenyingzhuangia heitensis TaxID=1487859 RepID=A0ABX0U9B3_9FLAO|nr:sulfatase-like hydrolase/transferase [Wenyingzhuangia heitensis]NIJ45338.1 arylsulfatase A-like enzyme [Wenyingzhuangia heitensis]